MSIFSHCDIEFGEKRKIRAFSAFKVIEVVTNRKPVCDFLLVINSNRHLVPFRSYRSLLFRFWTLHFWATFWGLRDNQRRRKQIETGGARL